ncbi:hypothetical protein RB195_004018 [Necator americanus]|uniref:Protein MCM10 homolog n=1 Tax=Necator americanus TaxID=51031 RepID=A0ABR1BI06_NECAM
MSLFCYITTLPKLAPKSQRILTNGFPDGGLLQKERGHCGDLRKIMKQANAKALINANPVVLLSATNLRIRIENVFNRVKRLRAAVTANSTALEAVLPPNWEEKNPSKDIVGEKPLSTNPPSVTTYGNSINDRSLQSVGSLAMPATSSSFHNIKDVNVSVLLHHDEVFDKDKAYSNIHQVKLDERKMLGCTSADASSPKIPTKDELSIPKSGLRIIDLNFDVSPETEQPCTSKQQIFCDGDEKYDEMMDSKEDLSEAGIFVQKLLNRREERIVRSEYPHLQKVKPLKSNREEMVVEVIGRKHSLGPSMFNSFFHFNIRNPKISSATFESYIYGLKRILISDLSRATPDNGFVTVGVIVRREARKSANGNDYVVWELHDLRDCQNKCVRLLLFGDACKEHWKTQAGGCIAVMNPQVKVDEHIVDKKVKSNADGVTLKAFKRTQVIELGVSSDFGICRGVKLDGQRCSKFVNISLSDFCVHHVMKEARKLSAKRVFNSVASHSPIMKSANSSLLNKVRNAKYKVLSPQNFGTKLQSLMHPKTSSIVVPSEQKTTTKSEERVLLDGIINAQAHSLAARNIIAAVESRAKHVVQRAPHDRFSMADFIRKQEVVNVQSTPHVPQLGYGLRKGEVVSLAAQKVETARMRAAVILNQEKLGSFKKKPVKRHYDEQETYVTAPKRFNLYFPDDDANLETLLRRRSMQDSEVGKAHGVAAQKHLDVLEQQEKVETFITECMSVKDVKVVSCKKCDYTAQKQSELCRNEGHCVTFTTAEKRFFKCNSCHKRTVVFSRLPTKSCKHCFANDWVRVAMRDEKKVKLENEQLLLRGEERKFVNS